MKSTTVKLKKVAGQIGALAGMVEANESCEKLITQFQAAKGALDGAFNDFLMNNLDRCVKNKKDKDLENIIKQIARK